MKYARQFYVFMYDFLVGDSWELFVGPIVVLIAGWALIQAGISAVIVGVLMFVAVVAIAASNVLAAVRHSA